VGEYSFIPKYRQLTDLYKSKISNQVYSPGDPIDSINRMMMRHGVSRETAELVLQQLIQEGLITPKNGKGPVVSSKVRKSNIWGMIIPYYSPNMERLIHHLKLEAQKRGKQLSYFLDNNSPTEEMKIVSKMINEGYGSVIVVPNSDETEMAEFYSHADRSRSQLILVDRTMSGSSFRYVVQGYGLGMKRAVDHFTENTTGNLLLIKSDHWKGKTNLFDYMEQIFTSTVSLDYPDREALILEDIKGLDKKLIRNSNITGILTVSDTDAIRVIGSLKEWGVNIPEQVRLLNYGDTELCVFYDPTISVVDCKYELLAAKTAELIDKGQDAGPYEQHVIQPELVIRNT
jgi:DNA-binding LacI/PurR family transcriptional regulator